MLHEQKPIKNFEDLPEDLRNVEVLRDKYRNSIILSSTFGASACVLGYKIQTAEVKAPPTQEDHQIGLAYGITTMALGALFLLGACASVRLRKFIRQGEEMERHKDNSPSP